MRFLPQFALLTLLIALGVYAAVVALARARQEAVTEVTPAADPPGEAPTRMPEAVATAPSTPSRPQEGSAPEVILERIKIAGGGPLLLVPVEFKGKTYQFVLDTGCSNGVFDSSLAPLLGDPLSFQDLHTTDGVTRVPVFPSPDAKLGGLSLQTGSPVVAKDLRRMREGLGVEVYGCIGMDFLARRVFRVDPDGGEIVFLQSPGADPGRRLDATVENKIPYVRIRLAGLPEPQPFLVDTGCVPGGGTGLLRADTFDALAGQGRVTPIDTVLAGSLSGPSMRRRGRMAEVEVAGHRHSDLIFSASQRNILGVTYWSRYVATFDFSGGAIYLKKSGRFDQPDTHDLSGLSVVRVGGRTVVVAVDDATPAAQVGIRPQDVILKVNGVSAGDMALVAVRSLLAMKGAKVTVLLGRGSQEQETSFTLPN